MKISARYALIFFGVHTILAVLGLYLDSYYTQDSLVPWLMENGYPFPLLLLAFMVPARILFSLLGFTECAGVGGPGTICTIQHTVPVILAYFLLGGVVYALIGYGIGKLLEKND